jgi:pilus assembly protein Flp/PilA
MSFLYDENGQSIVEYALIIGLIAVAAIVILVALGPKVQDKFDGANKALDNATESAAD